HGGPGRRRLGLLCHRRDRRPRAVLPPGIASRGGRAPHPLPRPARGALRPHRVLHHRRGRRDRLRVRHGRRPPRQVTFSLSPIGGEGRVRGFGAVFRGQIPPCLVSSLLRGG